MSIQPWDAGLDEAEWQTWDAGPDTFTYDDHKSIQHRAAVAERLTARGQGMDVPAAAQQRRRLDRIGTRTL
ncbi:hypothetical protein [Nonomuraea dietziae]|uniref:hypothetical protein n=1 Tax=Nonomuraea dietziae TaxID=65515 RepID=UPI0033C209B2